MHASTSGLPSVLPSLAISCRIGGSPDAAVGAARALKSAMRWPWCVHGPRPVYAELFETRVQPKSIVGP
jgi:hypothetical protein